jgi:hypothetical protein
MVASRLGLGSGPASGTLPLELARDEFDVEFLA